MKRVENMPAWHLTEGDELVDGHIVLEVRREPCGRTVRVLTSERVASELPHDAPVPVVRRGPAGR